MPGEVPLRYLRKLPLPPICCKSGPPPSHPPPQYSILFFVARQEPGSCSSCSPRRTLNSRGLRDREGKELNSHVLVHTRFCNHGVAHPGLCEAKERLEGSQPSTLKQPHKGTVQVPVHCPSLCCSFGRLPHPTFSRAHQEFHVASSAGLRRSDFGVAEAAHHVPIVHINGHHRLFDDYSD